MNPKKDESVRLNNKEAMLGRYLSQQIRKASINEGPVGPCPPLENIAAFIDGKLSGAEREELIVHLNRCDDCYEVFIETVKVMEEMREDSPEKDPEDNPIRSKKIFYYIVPSLFAAAAAMALFFIFPASSPHLPGEKKTIAKVEETAKQGIPVPAETRKKEDQERKALEKGKGTPLSVREMVARLSEQVDLKPFIKDTQRRSPQVSYGFAGALPVKKVSFRVGASMTSLNAALLSGDGERAKEFIKRIISLIEGVEGSGRAVEQVQNMVNDIDHGNFPKSLPKDPPSLEEVFEKKQALVYLKLGEWVEGAKLAASAGKTNLISPETARYFIDHLQGDDVPPGVTHSLLKIEKIVREGKGGEEIGGPLKKAFGGIEELF